MNVAVIRILLVLLTVSDVHLQVYNVAPIKNLSIICSELCSLKCERNGICLQTCIKKCNKIMVGIYIHTLSAI